MSNMSLRRFLRDRSGHFAIMTAITMVPLLLGVGLATDYTRLTNARSHVQDLADSAVMAAAASGEKDEAKVRDIVERQYLANYTEKRAGTITLEELVIGDTSVRVGLSSSVPMTFMTLAGYNELGVSAVAVANRNIGNLEVALVLDNTWSMSELDFSGVSKMAALKSSALLLVDELTKEKNSNVKIAIVPYADYVNVGAQYRNASWLSVPDDYSVAPKERTCVTLTTKSVCVQREPSYACTKVIDGVAEPATCGGNCTKSQTQTVAPYQSCSGGGSPTVYTWHGCVGSRMDSNSRLHDDNPRKPYPGYVETSQKCLRPLLPLTNKKADVVAAINGMILNIGSYKPYTYIPAGVIWGLNVLSPSEPFAQGADYDGRNRNPRKAMVLMTDGENTLRFSNSDGRHVAPSSNASKAKGELKKTNSDTAAICDEMKSKGIEIFSVAFMVDDSDARSLLESCASGPEYYFDASNAAKLKAAFQEIGRSLVRIRLTQ